MTKHIAPKTLENPAIAKALTQAIAAQPAINGGHDAKVAALIKAAVRAAGTMVQKCREAAKAAAEQFNPELTPHQNVEAVVKLYAEDFGTDHNTKAVFKDALWLMAAQAAPVTLVKKGKDGTEVEQHITAAQAVDMGKHDLRAAAKQVREQEGAGRAAGGGRKSTPTSPTRATEARKADPAATAPGPVAEAKAEDVFLHNLAAYLQDVAMLDKIKAVCAEGGFRLSKAPTKK